MNKFVEILIRTATNELNCREEPKGSNRSLCIDNYNETVLKKKANLAWCATFVCYIFEKTFQKFGLKNSFIKTASTTDIYNWGKKNNLLDKVPAVGSVHYSTREGGGHVGLVVEVNNSNEFTTIDGNSDDSVRVVKRKLTDKDYKFIHTEKLFNIEQIAKDNILLPVLIIASGLALWYLKK